MTITFPLSLPAPKFASVRIGARSSVGMTSSPFTYSQQAQAHQGQLWSVDVSYPPLVRADAEEVLAFLLSLNGPGGSFLAGDPLAAVPRGTATGTPVVSGDGQTGQSLVTTGWTISTTGILLAGDYIQLGTGTDTHLHKVLVDADSDGAGEATLDIWPRLRSSPADAAAITVAPALGLWRLASNAIEWNERQAQMYGVSFGAIEYLVA